MNDKDEKGFGNASREEISHFYSTLSHNVRNLRESRDISQLDLA